VMAALRVMVTDGVCFEPLLPHLRHELECRLIPLTSTARADSRVVSHNIRQDPLTLHIFHELQDGIKQTGFLATVNCCIEHDRIWDYACI